MEIARNRRALALIILLCSWGGRGALEAKPQRLSKDGEISLIGVVESGRLDALTWPDFSEYRAEVEKFYEARDYRLAWVRKSKATPQAREIAELFARAEEKGLLAEDYDGSNWAGRLARLKDRHAPLEEDLIRFDLAVTICAMRYISDLHIGRANPGLFHSSLDIQARRQGLAQFLQERIENARDVEAEFASLDPPFPAYRRTEQAFRRYLELTKQNPEDPLLKSRAEQLRLTLERMRWLPHEFSQPPIVVNIPAFLLYAINSEYRRALSMKVVVGKAYTHETPVFASEMRYLIFRPYWDVPLSIVRDELFPEIERDSAFLTEKGYEVVDRAENNLVVNEINAEIVDELWIGELSLRQKPGPDNPLGSVKFVMPNSHDVYLHATPALEAFSRSRRDFSHGCIRVEDPVALAAWVLRDKPEWGVGRIRAAMAGDKTLRVGLTQPIPVLVLYATAVALEDGEVRFYEDIYGQDALLKSALESRRQQSYQHRTRPVFTWTKLERP